MIKLKKPELLAPAGDMEKLEAAVYYGADAVYIGGMHFGLRAKAKNFTPQQMPGAIAFAHQHGVKVYVTVNIFAEDADFEALEAYIKDLSGWGVDACIVSDPGVFSLIRDAAKDMEIHISTQANNTNSRSALFWYKQGAKRVVAARELSLEQISVISKNLPEDMKMEAFVHGAMCVSYSGRCLLSSFLTDRNANKGHCSQPCRWEYALVERTRKKDYYPILEDGRGSYILNSKDLCMAAHIKELHLAGVDSFKIEGRMKTAYYTAAVVKAYRQAIDDYFEDEAIYQANIPQYMAQIRKVSHRHYDTGFYFRGKPTMDLQYYDTSAYIRNWDYVGIVRSYDLKTKTMQVNQRNKFAVGDDIEVLQKCGNGFTFTVKDMRDETGAALKSAPHPNQLLSISVPNTVDEYDMLRVLRD